MTETAHVIIWGTEIGAVTWDTNRNIGVFQYVTEFLASGIEISPLMMPVNRTV